MKNVIIRYKKIISIGRAKLATPASADITNYYDSTDSRYQDFTSLGIKYGDIMYWKNPYTQKTEKLGAIASSGSNASKFVLQSHAPTIAHDATQAYGHFSPMVFRENMAVSYPLNLYRGARTASSMSKAQAIIEAQQNVSYSSNLVSLFFERAPGYLDEIKLRVKEGDKFFNKTTSNDILFVSSNLRKISSSLLSVDKILSSIAPS